MKRTENALVILAGGIGERVSKKLPKQFNEINGKNLIDFFLNRIKLSPLTCRMLSGIIKLNYEI